MSRSSSSLTPPIKHVLDLMIAWTRVHSISAVLIESYARHVSTSPAKGKICVGHSPTRKKYRDAVRLNRGGAIIIQLRYRPPPLLPGPTIPVGPPLAILTCHVAPLTDVCVGPSTWPPATRQPHLRLAWATRALPRGLSAASHLEVVPRATSAAGHHVTLQVSKIPFFPILIRKI